MTLPATGPISIGQIRSEMLSPSGSLRALSALAQKTSPDSMSEFRGFSNGPNVPTLSGSINSTQSAISLVVGSGGGATPQTYMIQVGYRPDYDDATTLYSGVTAGTFTDTDIPRSSLAQTKYYRASALAQTKTSGWRSISVTIPASGGAV